MAKNEHHPVFAKDAALVQDFNDWFVGTSAHLTNPLRKRQLLEHLDETNTLADNVKRNILTQLDRLDEGFSVKPDGPPGFAQANPQRGQATPAYQQQRAQIFTRFAEVNNRIWNSRKYWATELDRALDFQDIKATRRRERMPTQLIEAARSSPALQEANTAYEQLTKRPAPAKIAQPDQEQTRS